MQCIFDKGAINITNRYLTWKIENFDSLPLNVGCEIRSPEFYYGLSLYTLVIWPRGKKGLEEWFGLYLYNSNKLGNNDPVQFTITSKFGDIKTCTVECSKHNFFMQEKFMEWSDFCALGPKIIPNGCLTIVCKMSEEKYKEHCIHNGKLQEGFRHSARNMPIKCQHDTYGLHDPLSIASAVKLKYIESQATPCQVSEFNSGSPSTNNSFYSAQSSESEFESDSVEASDFKTPYMATTAQDKFWSRFTRGFRASKTNNPSTIPNSMRDNSQNSTFESLSDSTVERTENKTAADNLNSSKVIKDGSVTEDSKNSSSVSGKLFSQTRNANAERNETSYPQRDAAQIADGLYSVDSSEDIAAMLHHSSSDTLTSTVVIGLKITCTCQRYKELYLKGINFDLRIIMAEREFKVHRSILMAQSPVFFRLLTEDSDRNRADIISIDPFGPCDSTIFHDFLLYMYSGELENLSLKTVSGLYFAACKFEQLELKEVCVEFLRMLLAIDAIADIFRFIKHESELLDIALIFLAKHLEVIMPTDEWKQFVAEEPDWAMDLNLKALQIGFKKTIT